MPDIPGFLTEIGGWHGLLADTDVIEQDGKQIPLRDVPTIKETPTVGTLARRLVESQRELGGRIPLKVSTPEEAAKWKQDHLPKLYQAGILESPLESPEKYEITLPETLAGKVELSPDLVKKAQGIFHAEGFTPKQATAAVTLYHNIFEWMIGDVDKETAEADTALRAEWGGDYDAKFELMKRARDKIFTPDEVNFLDQVKVGTRKIGNHPHFLSAMAKIGAGLQEGDGSPPGPQVGEDPKTQIADMMSNPQNPWYEKLRRGDPEATAHKDALYKLAYGTKEV